MDKKIALVTAAANGIGRATAEKFAECGCHLLLVDIADDPLRRLNECLKQKLASAEVFVCDVTRADDVADLFGQISETYGKIDYAVNAVGGSVPGGEKPLGELSFENWQAELDLNLTSTFLCMSHEIRMMKAGGGGCIVNVSSIAGLGGSGSNAAYTAGKHAVVGLTKQAAIECGPFNIRVNAICPGAVRTPMLDLSFGGDPNFLSALAQTNVLERVADPREIAEPIYWLCSDTSSFMTGSIVTVDGGTTAIAVNAASNRR